MKEVGNGWSAYMTELRDQAYNDACAKGFHDEKHSYRHWMMLIICEVAEVIEADRRGKHADLRTYNFESFSMPEKFRPDLFERKIKDTVEDELADVCIRVLDFMGLEHIELNVDRYLEEHPEELIVNEDNNSLISNCFDIVDWLISVGSYIGDEKDDLNFVLDKIIAWCLYNRIDIFQHIELKMKYNKTRERMHGKRY